MTPFLLQLVVLSLPAIALAWLLRRCEAPGGRGSAALIGGAVTGILLGASVLGQLNPEAHDRLFISGVEQSRAVREVASRHRADAVAMRASGAHAQDIAALAQRHESELEPLRREMLAAQARHRERLDWIAAAFIGAYLVAAAPKWARCRRPRSAYGPAHRTDEVSRTRARLIGAFALFIASAPPTILGLLLLRMPLRLALALGLIFAIPGLSRTLGRTAYTSSAAGLIVGLIGTALLVPPSFIILLGAALAIGVGVWIGIPRSLRRPYQRMCNNLQFACLLPILAAMAAVRIDLYALADQRSFWILVAIAILWSSDGRWLGSALAQRSLAHGAPFARWSIAAAQVNAGAAQAQLIAAMTLSLGGAAALAGSDLLAASLVGAIFIELTANLRNWIGRMMDAPPPASP